MTVVKSIALGAARKSVGDLNYYRVRGVQMVRRKAVFTPNRVFTTAQVKQQSKMQRAQSLLHAYNGMAIVNATNVTTNRKYSTTSRVNRFVGSCMDYGNLVVPINAPSDLDLLAYSAQTVLRVWSLGSLELPNYLSVSPGAGAAWDTLTFGGLKSYCDKWLQDFNKTRSKNGQLDYANIGVVGWMQHKNAQESFLSCFGVQSLFFDDAQGVGQPYTVLDWADFGVYSHEVYVSFCFGLFEEKLEDDVYPNLRALACTRSTKWFYLDDSSSGGGGEEDRPVVQ